MKKILHDFIWNNLALCSFRFHILACQVYILSNTLEGFTPRDYHGHISSLVYINIGWKLFFIFYSQYMPRVCGWIWTKNSCLFLYMGGLNLNIFTLRTWKNDKKSFWVITYVNEVSCKSNANEVELSPLVRGVGKSDMWRHPHGRFQLPLPSPTLVIFKNSW